MQQVNENLSGLREGAASGSGAQAVERALQLLSIVGRGAEKGVALADVVADSGLNKPTARRLLMALMRSRLVEQDELTRRYYLGGELYVLGMLASRRHGLLEMAGESLKRLSAKSADTSFVSMRRDDYAVCLHREEGTHPVRTHALLTGDQNPLGVGAGSLAMLAALPDAEVEAILGRIEGVITAQYPGYSTDIIREDVVRTRELGYALNPGRVIANSWGIGMAILLPDGRLAGALSIAAIDSRMGEVRQKELAAQLAHEVERVQGKLKSLFSSENPAPRKAPQTARSRTPERV
ncbi:IclR family transcriptional regulator [Neorhizobium galegae]|uniref:IclR family transcriptional regulator n=1 Tax=Neorhizobium galegae TaxID=399 RepID=UPI00062126ED|nr:IclR family transcriptional regulator [Neorhizobium galegae]CDZ29733.1 IclR-family regulatory protein [Neorhizobium galegae bv. officinalis]KAA9385106.1 IclR family transcriptional regulator [Neorhizobium galegae]KAB1110556.1 IclR family transcriptional regulator [Neorhizobium galegae]MCM2501399.1 IclR family transcriptional regulator [Neorhizobium galegae]MCQ1773599.1 IclR family transcriptional regulator [Neorhizobium galegae]